MDTERLLHDAVLTGDLHRVARAIRVGANVNHANWSGATPLTIAAGKGHADIVQVLLSAGARANHTDTEQTTALILAAEGGHTDVVRELLTAGANVNHADRTGMTALSVAARNGHAPTVDRLLAARANVNHANWSKRTPLTIAAAKGYVAIVKRLIAAGADVNHATRGKSTALGLAADEGHVDVVDTLLSAGASLNHADRAGMTALALAASNGHADTVAKLLSAGADVAIPNWSGRTALITAAAKGHTGIVERLLAARASVDAVDDNGDSALLQAAQQGHDDVARVLLKAGADPTQRNKAGLNAQALLEKRGVSTSALLRGQDDPTSGLFRAVERGDVEQVQRLLETKSAIAQRCDHARTPLHIAAQHGQVNVLKLLIQREAKLSSRDDGGWTPLHMACAHGHVEAADLLLNHGASVDMLDDHGLGPVEVAALNGHLKVVRALVGHGARLTNIDTDGRTVLHHAILSRNALLVDHLLSQDVIDASAVDKHGLAAVHYAVHSHATLVELQNVASMMIRDTHSSDSTSEDDDQIPMLRALLAVKGVDANVRNKKGETALLIASALGKAAAVRLLLDHGADADVVDISGRTPLSTAASEDIRAVIELYHNSQQYHERCFALLNDPESAPTMPELNELVPLITSVYDLRLMLTLGALCEDTANHGRLMKAAFQHIITKGLTFDDEACVFFKFVLKRCKRDKLVSAEDVLLFDRRAEKANNENAEWVVEIKKQVHWNSWRLATHEQHLHTIVDGVRDVHAMVVANRNAIVATASRVENLQHQVDQGKALLRQLSGAATYASTRMEAIEKRLARSEANIQHVATHLTNFRDAYLNQQEQEEKNRRTKRVCGIVASIAGFVIGPVLKELADIVIDFANPVKIVTKVYETKDIVDFLTNQSKEVLPEVIASQMVKYGVNKEEFDALLRESIALQHPELVEECSARGLVVAVDGGKSQLSRSYDPLLRIEEGAVTEILTDLRLALKDSSTPSTPFRMTDAPRRSASLPAKTDFSGISDGILGTTKATRVPMSTSALHTSKSSSSLSTSFEAECSPPTSTHPANQEAAQVILPGGGDVFPYHVAVQESLGSLVQFQELTKGIDTSVDADARMEMQMTTATTTREMICAAQFAYLLGYTDVGDAIGARLDSSPDFDDKPAKSVTLEGNIEDFPYVLAVVESGGDVEECEDCIDTMDDSEHALSARIQAVVVREVSESVSWTVVEYASHLGYVDIVKYLLKDVCKPVSAMARIQAIKVARERAKALT